MCELSLKKKVRCDDDPAATISPHPYSEKTNWGEPTDFWNSILSISQIKINKN